MIGVVGGVGPYAGLDLVQKIFDQTIAESDQEHLDVSLISMPALISDRTAFLLAKSDQNPARGILQVIKKLEAIGAHVVGIPCNSAHAPAIFDAVVQKLEESESSVRLINMIEEVVTFIRKAYPKVGKVGVLSTTGTYRAGIYSRPLRESGFKVVVPDEDTQHLVHESIYHRDYGVKAQSNPATQQARQHFLQAIDHLRNKGAQVVILGCTEIPLAVNEQKIEDTALIDPAVILARALIREVRPDKLKPISLEFDRVNQIV